MQAEVNEKERSNGKRSKFSQVPGGMQFFFPVTKKKGAATVD
jgi:hypothetical protein